MNEDIPSQMGVVRRLTLAVSVNQAVTVQRARRSKGRPNLDPTREGKTQRYSKRRGATTYRRGCVVWSACCIPSRYGSPPLEMLYYSHAESSSSTDLGRGAVSRKPRTSRAKHGRPPRAKAVRASFKNAIGPENKPS